MKFLTKMEESEEWGEAGTEWEKWAAIGSSDPEFHGT